jgi:hypothetical protein
VSAQWTYPSRTSLVDWARPLQPIPGVGIDAGNGQERIGKDKACFRQWVKDKDRLKLPDVIGGILLLADQSCFFLQDW